MGIDQQPLDEGLQALYEAARAAAARAYVPYSGFRVGAALRGRDGTITTGCNVENASFGLTICAERVACMAAIAQGHGDFDAIAIHVDADDGQPCGACRQVLSEFAPDMLVLYRMQGVVRARPLRELLPDGFEPAALNT